MDPELSKIEFKKALDILLRKKDVIEHYGWVITVEGFDVYIQIHPSMHEEMKYLLRLRCDDFPARAPSLQFVSSDTKEVGREYWPNKGDLFSSAVSRSNPPQLCTKGIREFHEGCHSRPRDKEKYPWNAKKLPFAKVLEEIQLESLSE